MLGFSVILDRGITILTVAPKKLNFFGFLIIFAPILLMSPKIELQYSLLLHKSGKKQEERPKNICVFVTFGRSEECRGGMVEN